MSTIRYYSRYADNVLIISDTKETTEKLILEKMNQIYKNLEFNLNKEETNQINHLDLTISRH
jgi:hypothetical protein